MNSSAEVMMRGFSVATVRRESPTEKIRNGGGAARATGLDSVTIPTTADNTMSAATAVVGIRSEEHTSELQSRPHLVCRLLLGKKTGSNDLEGDMSKLAHRLRRRRAHER